MVFKKLFEINLKSLRNKRVCQLKTHPFVFFACIFAAVCFSFFFSPASDAISFYVSAKFAGSPSPQCPVSGTSVAGSSIPRCLVLTRFTSGFPSHIVYVSTKLGRSTLDLSITRSLDLSELLPAPPPSRQVLSSSVSSETIVRMQ